MIQNNNNRAVIHKDKGLIEITPFMWRAVDKTSPHVNFALMTVIKDLPRGYNDKQLSRKKSNKQQDKLEINPQNDW